MLLQPIHAEHHIHAVQGRGGVELVLEVEGRHGAWKAGSTTAKGNCGAIGEGNGFGAVKIMIMREVTSEESRHERGGGTGIDQGKGRDGRDGDGQQNALGSMRIFAKRNGFHIWTMRHKILSRKEFSELIIIICVCVWAFYASGVAHVWFPVSFVIILVREHYSWVDYSRRECIRKALS
jgi:hypothetical protein